MRPSATECPSHTVLVELAGGRLAGAAAARLTPHLQECSACRSALEALSSVEQRVAAARTSDVGIGTTISSSDPRAASASQPRAGALHAEMVGVIIDRKYQLCGLIGEGGMGSVYEATVPGRSEPVAVKLVSGRLLGPNTEAASRFRREARAASSIASPNIVRILDSGVDGPTGHLYLAMERLRGEDLERLIARTGPLAPDVALRIAAQALAGLENAHAAGIVHRDIKPANIFLARGEGSEVTVKLLDFGIAKTTDLFNSDSGHTTGLTQAGGLLGSPLYMSPEQVQSSADVDGRTDLWSLGSVLYCALAGAPPHRHIDAVGKLIVSICTVPPRPVRQIAAWVPPEVESVVQRALTIRQEDRWGSAAAMRSAIEALLPGGSALREEMLVGLASDERRSSDRGAPAGEDEPAAIREPAVEIEAGRTVLAPPQAKAPRATRWCTAAAVLVAAAAGGLAVERWVHRLHTSIDAERLSHFAPLPSSRPDQEGAPSPDAVALGQALFSDPRLSKNGDVACVSCHPLDRYGADGARFSTGSDGKMPGRNTLAIYNVTGYFALFWDGRQDDLFELTKEVLQLPRAMAATKDKLGATLQAAPEYRAAFARAFPGEPEPVSFDNTARALAAFQSTLYTRGRWDRFLEGDRSAITDVEKAGFNRFVDVGCIMCHFGPNVGATMFQKVGLVKAWPDEKDLGRFAVTKRGADRMMFRVPSLRNVARTAPYFHDGSVASLDMAIRVMARHEIGRELDDDDVSLIKSWLECLTGEIPKELLPAGAPPAPPRAPR